MSKRGNKEGSIFKQTKGGKTSWVCQVHLGYRDNGKPRYKQYQRKTRGEALAKLEEVKRELYAGTFVDNSKIGFNEWIKEYLEIYSQPKIRQKTYDNYESLARVHIYPVFANLRLQEVQTNFIQRFLSEKAKVRSHSTVQKLRIILNEALQQAVKERRIRENPVVNTILPRAEAKEAAYLSEDNIKALLAVARNHRLYYVLVLAISTGLRRGELLGLQWQDIDFVRNTLSVKRSYVTVKAGNIMQEPKTKASRRLVAVPADVMNVLKAAKANSQPENPWVVPVEKPLKNVECLPVAPRSLSRTYALWCQKAGISNVGIHTLRHTYASHALSQNIHMKAVQAQLGHSDIQTTMNIYTHITASIQQEAAEKMNSKLLSWLPLERDLQEPADGALH